MPEAYRQKFRELRKRSTQTHTELVREIELLFTRWCNASAVKSYEDLVDLIVLEQFKNTLPNQSAIYIAERNVSTAAEAAALADEYDLIHRPCIDASRLKNECSEKVTSHFMQPSNMPTATRYVNTKFSDKTDSALICNYCLGYRHWKKDCPVLQSKGRNRYTMTKPTTLAALVPAANDLIPPFSTSKIKEMSEVGCLNSSFSPFVSGFVSLPEGDKIPVKILRDTGASASFILESVLPFSKETFTGDSLLICGIGLTKMSVPLSSPRF